MKEALFYEKKKNNAVQCRLCPRNCVIKEGERGNCRVRENKRGVLYSLVYGNPCSVAIDPIEKKPFYHFIPGTTAFSIGTAGCNLHCKHCQNYEISQANPEDVPSLPLPPEDVVREAVNAGCRTIAYTYNDPVIFFEYLMDTAKIAKKKGMKNVVVSNGFINREPLLEWCKVLDAANIDLKFFNTKKYMQISNAWLEPVLETIRTLRKKKVWVEITNLIIPTLNDDMDEIKKMCEWIRDNAGRDVPLHFTAFYPCYKLANIPPTPAETLRKAKEIADDVGLHHAYIGNVFAGKEGNTYCPACSELVVEREPFFNVSALNIKDGKCVKGHRIAGVWE